MRPTFACSAYYDEKATKSNLKVTGFGPRIFRSSANGVERKNRVLGCSGTGGGGSLLQKKKTGEGGE